MLVVGGCGSGVGCRVLGVECRVLGVGCWVLGAGCWVLGVGCWVLGVGCWVLGVGCWVLGSRQALRTLSQVRSWSHWCVLGAILLAFIAKSFQNLQN